MTDKELLEASRSKGITSVVTLKTVGHLYRIDARAGEVDAIRVLNSSSEVAEAMFLAAVGASQEGGENWKTKC